MKYLLRLISLLLVFSVCMASVAFCGSSITIGEDTAPVISEETDGYVYGIFTEKYNISYQKDLNGNIIMSKEDLEELNTLSNDMVSIEKILNDKAFANRVEKKTVCNVNVMQTADNIKKLDVVNLDENRVVINSTSETASADDLTNFNSNIKVMNVYNYDDDGFVLRIRYLWHWTYRPVCAFTDLVAVCWSDNLSPVDYLSVNGELVQSQFNYYQSGYRIVSDLLTIEPICDESTLLKKTTRFYGKEARTNVLVSSGCEKKYDIQKTFTVDDTLCYTYRHSGSMYVHGACARLDSISDEIIDYTGGYFHKKIAVGDPSISFDGKKFTLSAPASMVYDKAVDASEHITSSEILSKMSGVATRYEN